MKEQKDYQYQTYAGLQQSNLAELLLNLNLT